MKGMMMNKYLAVGTMMIFAVNIFGGEKTQHRKSSNSRRSSMGPSEKDKIYSALPGQSDVITIPNPKKRFSNNKSPRSVSNGGSQAVSPHPIDPEDANLINSPTVYFGIMGRLVGGVSTNTFDDSAR
jgi:hypothetical protein